MALRAVYTIDVDGSQFAEFRKLFDKYQEQLKALPPEWKSVNEAMAGASVAMAGLEKHAWGQASALSKQVEETKKLGTISRATAATWNGVTGSFMKVNEYITKATSSLLKWSTFTTALAGLLGAGSLFGIDRLANSINAQRRSAKGLGISYGQQAAITSNYNQIINPGSLLSNVVEAKYDETGDKFTALMNLGLSRKKIESENAAQIVMDLLAPGGALESRFKTIPKELWGTVAHQPQGADQLISVNDLIQYLNSSPESKKKLAEQTAADAARMDLSDTAQDKWAMLVTQLARASKDIEATFGESFAKFAPELGKLSDLFVKAADKIANSKLVDEWLTDLSAGLQNMATYIAKPEFTEGVESFVKWVGDAAKAVWDFVSNFGSGLKPNEEALPPLFMSPEGVPDGGSSSRAPMPGGASPLLTAPRGGGNSLTRAMGENTPIGQRGNLVSASGKPADALNWMMQTFGLSREQAFGPVGWMGFESGNFGTMHQRAPRPELQPWYDLHGDLGYPQWSGSRRAAMEAWVRANLPGVATDSERASRAYLEWDLKTNHPDILYALQHARNRDESMAAWVRYQGPYGPGTYEWNLHHQKMEAYHNQFGSAPSPTGDRLASYPANDTRREAIDSWRSAGKLPTLYLWPQTGANVARSAAMVTSPFTTVSP